MKEPNYLLDASSPFSRTPDRLMATHSFDHSNIPYSSKTKTLRVCRLRLACGISPLHIHYRLCVTSSTHIWANHCLRVSRIEVLTVPASAPARLSSQTILGWEQMNKLTSRKCFRLPILPRTLLLKWRVPGHWKA